MRRDYVRALIAADAGELAQLPGLSHLTFKNKSQVEKLIVEGIRSGKSSEITAADWNEKRRQLAQRHSK